MYIQRLNFQPYQLYYGNDLNDLLKVFGTYPVLASDSRGPTYTIVGESPSYKNK